MTVYGVEVGGTALPSLTKCKGKLVRSGFKLDEGSFRERSSCKTPEVQTRCEGGGQISCEILYCDKNSPVH